MQKNTTYNVLHPKTTTMTYASFATKLFKTYHDEYGYGYSIRAALIAKTILAQFKRDFPAYANDIECYDDQYPLLRFAEVSVNDLHEDYTWGPRYSSELSWKRIQQFCTPGSFISSFMGKEFFGVYWDFSG